MDNQELETCIANSINLTLRAMREYRDYLMSLPDEGEGRPHSHGETDNSRGLRIRAISLAITEMENAAKRADDAMHENLKEYYI